MRGRDIFSRFVAISWPLVFVFKIIPDFMARGIWNIISGWHGYLGLGFRYCMLKARCLSCGDNVFVGPYVEIISWENLSIGKNISIHRQSYIDATGEIYIGDNVSIAHSTSIVSFDHSWENVSIPIRDNPIILRRITIANDVWIGCGCRILCGTTIGTRSIVAAGAVISKDVPQGSLVGGVPAKLIKEL